MKKILLFLSLCLCLPFFLSAQKGKKKRKNKDKSYYLQAARSTDEIRNIENKLEKLYYMQIGHFSNKNQADTTSLPIYAEQEYIVVPIWQERKGEYWLYWVWITADKPDITLCEGIFKFSRPNREEFLLEHYALPSELAGKTSLEWAQKQPLKKYKPAQLKKMDCPAYVTENASNEFEIHMDEPCFEFDLNALGDISSMAFRQIISPEVIRDFCSYTDAQGKFLFEYDQPNGLYLERLDKDKPKYPDLISYNKN